MHILLLFYNREPDPGALVNVTSYCKFWRKLCLERGRSIIFFYHENMHFINERSIVIKQILYHYIPSTILVLIRNVIILLERELFCQRGGGVKEKVSNWIRDESEIDLKTLPRIYVSDRHAREITISKGEVKQWTSGEGGGVVE